MIFCFWLKLLKFHRDIKYQKLLFFFFKVMSTLMSNMPYLLDIQHKIKIIKLYIPIKLQFYGN